VDEELRKKIDALEGQSQRATRWFYVWIALALLSISAAVIGPQQRTHPLDSPWWLAMWIIYATGALIAAAVNRIRVRFLQQDERKLAFEDDLRCYVPPTEHWAFKLLSANEDELRRYYQITLTQSAWIFIVGLLSLAGGFIIIAVTFAQLRSTDSQQDKLIVAVLGAVGTIGAQMVGAIFMRMNTAIATNMQAFHGRLVDTHQLLFGNLLGNRVEGHHRRSDTWAKMALALMRLPATAVTAIPDDTSSPNPAPSGPAMTTGQAQAVAAKLSALRPALPSFA
jgi:hypothetical protein